jgi:serine/threonine protein kinase
MPPPDQPDTGGLDPTGSGPEKPTARVVGGYELLAEVGRGGMGIVYKARQRDLDRIVAVKQLHSVHADAPEHVWRFIRESQLTGSLNHPNIVTVHDYFKEHDTSYIAMEYMPNGSLRAWTGSLSLAQLAGVLEGLLAGLAAVEPSGVVHRDLKPENVLVTNDGRVKIADFGIAKTIQSDGERSFVTATGVMVGTPAYMAPEQALAETIGPWSDLYSIGVMTYEQLVGRVPFHESPTPTAMLLRHIHDPIPPVIDIRPDIDPRLSDWVARLLIKEPTGRTASAVQAWEELEEIVLELLDSRWRREARLPEHRSSVSSAKPLTPAPFAARPHSEPHPAASPEISAPAAAESDAAVEPEFESRLLSYARAPTGAEPVPAAKPRTPRSSTEVPAAGAQERHSQPPDPSTPAPVGRSSGVRRLSFVALLIALTGLAGFALAPTSNGTGAPVHSDANTTAERQRQSNRLYAAALSDAMSKLNTVRANAGAQLARAQTAHLQAVAAQRLADAHAWASVAVRGADPSSPARATNTEITNALTHAAAGYSMMASGARRETRSEFNRGRTAVTLASHSLAAAFMHLRKLGYKLEE